MKTSFLTILLTLALMADSVASGPPIIDISSSGSDVRYHLENTNARTEKEAKTLDEVEEWTRDLLKVSPEELFMIYPDASTTYKTVSDLLRRLKTAGCGQFAVVTLESASGETTVHSLVGRTDKNLTERESSPSAKKPERLESSVLSAPESSSERAKWLAGMAAESYEKRDYVRAEVLCLIAIELDPYCIPARRTLEKLDPPGDQGRRRSREWETRSAAHQQLRAAVAELEEAETEVAAQQKDPDSQKYFEMARQAWKRFSHADSQLRAFKSTQGASHGYDVTYLRTLTEMTKERTQQLRQQAKAE